MPITKIEIENLTVFKKMEMNVEAPVNVLIGENGTGKTHLLKFIYMTFMNLHSKLYDTIVTPDAIYLDKDAKQDTLAKNFLGLSPSKLIRDKEVDSAVFTISYQKDKTITYRLSYDSAWTKVIGKKTYSESRCYNFDESLDEEQENLVFIPAKDMLTHSKGLPSMKKKYGRFMPFDETSVGIVEKAFHWNLAEAPVFAKGMLEKLEKIMNGTVIVENEEFFILRNDGTKISFHVEAEGIKKIGLIWQLLMNDNIKEDTILLWDEPEANINPNLIPTLAEIILELGRHGVQVFLATHDFFLPKYIEVLSEEKDKVAFHALYKTDDDGVQCETDEKFTFLDHNAIIDERINLYEKEIEKGLS